MFRTKTLLAAADCHSYEEYVSFLAGEKSRDIARNVNVRQHYGKVYVRVHDTDILVFYPGGSFSADNGGYNTVTTSDRLTQFGPRNVRFYHAAGNLFCENRGPCPDHTTRYPVVRRGRPRLETKQHPNAGLKTRKHRKLQLG
ncbi:MAG TPA: hypothetical protein VD866_08555 [Urbifossiella sp.]|nr:hypothetical protein [Urbifossiella sp.]